jgi:hypothetical protein
VNVSMSVRGGETRQLTLYTMPMICEPLACQPISVCQADFKHLTGLPLADQSHSPCPSEDLAHSVQNIHRVALTADIEKAFLMVSVAPEDRDVLQFFWIDNHLMY